MVMDLPSPQIVGREFVRQYYTMLHEAPHFLHRFYSNDSSFLHESVSTPGDEQQPAIGQTEIFKKIESLNFCDCHAKIRQVDSQLSVCGSVVIQVIGELSNNSAPLRRFMQTFVLAPQSPRKFYVHNDIFRYQDEIFAESDVVIDGNDAVDADKETVVGSTTNFYGLQEHKEETCQFRKEEEAHEVPHKMRCDSKQVDASICSVEPHLHGSDRTSTTVSDHDETNNNEELFNEYQHDRNDDVGCYCDHHTGSLDVQTVVQSAHVQSSCISQNEKLCIQDDVHDVEHLNTAAAAADGHSNDSTQEQQHCEADDDGNDYEVTDDVESEVATREAADNEAHIDAQHQHSSIYQGDNTGTLNMHTSLATSSASVAVDKPSWAAMLRQTVSTTCTGKQTVNQTTAVVSRQPIKLQQQQLPSANNAASISSSSTTTSVSSAQQTTFNKNIKATSVVQQSTTQSSSNDEDTSTMQQYPDSQQIFVGNLPHNMTDMQLKDFFQQFGNVLDMRINRKINNNLPNFGFVVFNNQETVQSILKCRPLYNGKQRVNVEEKKCKEDLSGNRPRSSSNKQQQQQQLKHHQTKLSNSNNVVSSTSPSNNFNQNQKCNSTAANDNPNRN
ncbi:hypothetical protein HELRODRAFT_115988 [Helobdella robusta]|uniref:NTF2 domain-containing protein n=1 Tax=Helobdella robusta TaxID=6412 RepID=T1EGC4_HELRO|nr:hypothetical protein HELRODRAFT_115988 [Helobdella robusta]ESN92364.1 hypothetical protein HELRODRAFT_115988 [Helobdella robusta]